MAAFINALYEEGSKEDCILWVQKMRDEQKLPKYVDGYWRLFTKQQLIENIVELWDSELAQKV